MKLWSVALESTAPGRARRMCFLIGGVLLAGCGAGPTRASPPPEAASSPPGASQRPAAPPQGQSTPAAEKPAHRSDPDERQLEGQATLDTILRVALARNPELVEAEQLARAERELAPSLARLPDPEFEYQLWAQPLSRPYALDEAQMHMFGLSQTLPAPGTLDARTEAATARANVAAESRRAREQALIARVRRAYAEYYRAEREYQIHLEHAKLAHGTVEMTHAAYQGGRGTQQDVLRASVAITRLHSEVTNVEAQRRTARGLLNVLMARPLDAPLGPPAPLDPASVQVRIDDLAQLGVEQRPELAAAKSAVAARASEVEGARAAGRWPSFMVGVQYMFMPMEEEAHNYGVTLSMSLPWLNARYGEELRAAEARASAEQSALASTRDAARYELFEASERLKGARQNFDIIERTLLPQAQQSFESAQAAYRGGSADSIALFDALGSLLDVRIERERALVRMDTALADIERALGGSIPPVQTRGGPHGR
ncbi:MAG TPA: TolC family protein [Polyangiaceae bacterium]|nr:TolC family protein [Polyangiaceae bacterium]